MTSTAIRTNRVYVNGNDSKRGSTIKVSNNFTKEIKRNIFDPDINSGRVSSIVKRRNSQDTEPKDDEAPKASLLKYEVRKLVDLRKVTDNFDRGSVRDRYFTRKRETSDVNELKLNGNSDKLRDTMHTNNHTNNCPHCVDLQQKIKTVEAEFEQERKSNELKFDQFEVELEKSQIERDEFTKTIKKLQRDIKKVDNNLSEEKIQTRRLGIKLEDANYEIGRLRQELINSQLENEKIVEDNEDLAVDNEDLIKERDEIIQIYDELFRESERLKHEVGIWKTVFENNKGSLPDVQTNEENENENEDSDDEDENVIMKIEEDISLLLPPRDDIKMKALDPSKMFDITEELGRGKFGKVYKAIAKSTGDAYAAKYIKVTSKLREDVLNTVEIMKKVHHVRLINLFDVYDLGAQIVIILEFVSGGMLFERIVENKSLTEADCIFYTKQILQGLYHIHSQQICHLEIKPENIVCTNRDSMDIKIIDFGLAKQLEVKKDIKITAGSPEFVAPEILSFDPVSLNSDMWSVGVVVYVLLSGLSPFIGEDDNDTLLNVSCGEFEFPENVFRRVSNDAKEFIKMLLVANPKERANVSTCLTHSWMKVTHQSKKGKIDLENMKNFLEKRKEKGNVSAVRAIRRFSSFGVGHGLLNTRNNPIIRGGSSRHLAIPNALQASVISEDEEDREEDKVINRDITKGPTFKITRDDADSVKLMRSRSRTNSREIFVPENTDTPDGLRQYLQRMINEGHLPGANGSHAEKGGEMSEDE